MKYLLILLTAAALTSCTIRLDAETGRPRVDLDPEGAQQAVDYANQQIINATK